MELSILAANKTNSSWSFIKMTIISFIGKKLNVLTSQFVVA
jgi:hypothetical protein